MTDADIVALGERNGWSIGAMAREVGRDSGAFLRRARKLRDSRGARPASAPPVAERSAPAPIPDIPHEVTGPTGRPLLVATSHDWHVPEHDRRACDAFLKWCADHRPDVLALGEIGEWLSMSRHGGNWGAMLDEDVGAVRRVLVQIRSVNPNAEIILQTTNHDTRLDRMIEERMPQIAGTLSLRSMLKVDDLGIRWVDERTVYRVGRLKILHGHQLATNERSGMLPENACKRAIERYGEPGHTVVFFHTHIYRAWSAPHDGGPMEAVNLPCMRTLRPEWLRGREAGWRHGFGAAYVDSSGQTNLYPVHINGGAFTFAGKSYSA